MSGEVKSQWRLTKVAPIAAINRWSDWNIACTTIHLLDTSGDTLPTPFGNSLPKNKNKNKKSRPAIVIFDDAMSFLSTFMQNT
jgi:hypothetical protein